MRIFPGKISIENSYHVIVGKVFAEINVLISIISLDATNGSAINSIEYFSNISLKQANQMLVGSISFKI